MGTAEASYERFFDDQFAPAARLAFLLTGDASSAEDLAQDSLAQVQSRYPTLDVPAAYLRTVLVNRCKRHHRTVGRQRALASRLDVGDPVVDEDRDLLDVVDHLPYRQKAVVVCRYYLDLSEAEIAAVLGCRPGTVKSLASRAMANLRKELTE